MNYTTRTAAANDTKADILVAALAGFIGLGVIFFAGFAQASVIHDASHDQRHSLAFPCH